METKKQIRSRILKERNALSEPDRREKSIQICERLFALTAFKAAQDILLYASYGSEVQTEQIFEKAVSLGKQVFYPKVEGETMQFFKVSAMTDLKEGYKRIREPAADIVKAYIPTEHKALMLMPGAAFDLDRNRIGYGKGFYDRFLGEGFAGFKIALAFDIQIVSDTHVPTDATDIRPDMVLTETRLLEGHHA